jgi:folate-dependent tRNA-U54 methylase TrmFO/GidA
MFEQVVRNVFFASETLLYNYLQAVRRTDSPQIMANAVGGMEGFAEHRTPLDAGDHTAV